MGFFIYRYMKKAHFIELDIILKTESKPWIVDKSSPDIPILKIDKYEFNLFKSGIYKSHGNKISFNGQVFWLPNDFMNKLKIKSKIDNINLSNLGISMQEFLNKDIIENVKYDTDITIFNPIINTNDDIYIFCSKNTKANFQKQIEKIGDKLEKIGLNVKNFYYISETFYNRNQDDISYTKSKILVQHLLGLKADGDKLTNMDIEKYDTISLYEDNQNSIKTCLDINNTLENLLTKSEGSVKSLVKDRIKNGENSLLIKEYTHNKVNIFKEHNVSLVYSNIIKNFENFK